MANKKDIDKLYGKGKQTGKQAKEQINKAINGNKKSSGSFRFPTKEITEKISKSNKIGEAINTANKVGRIAKATAKGGIGVFNALTGFDHFTNAQKLTAAANDALMRGDKKQYYELSNAALRERTAGTLILGTLGAGGIAKGASLGLGKVGSLLSKTAGSPMGKAVYNDLIRRGASQAGVNFMRMRPIVQRNLAKGLSKASAITGKIGDSALSFPVMLATPFVSDLIGKGVELGKNAWDSRYYNKSITDQDNKAREEYIQTLLNSGYSREEAERMANEVENGTGEQNSLTNNSQDNVVTEGNYGYTGATNTGYNQNTNPFVSKQSASNVPNATAINSALQGTQEQTDQQTQNGQPGFNDFVNRANNVYDAWQRSQRYYDPYRNDLSQYINDYRDLYDASAVRGRWLSALRGEGLDPYKFLPMDREANRIALEKQLASELEKQENDRSELIGNLGLANDMGLPPESVNASDKYLQNATKYREEEDKITQRRESQQLKYNAMLQAKQMEVDGKRDIARGNWQVGYAKIQAAMRMKSMATQASLWGAGVNALPYLDDTSALYDYLSLSPIGGAFQQPQPQVQIQRPQGIQPNRQVGFKDVNSYVNMFRKQ